jgi:hypothetical protein
LQLPPFDNQIFVREYHVSLTICISSRHIPPFLYSSSPSSSLRYRKKIQHSRQTHIYKTPKRHKSKLDTLFKKGVQAGVEANEDTSTVHGDKDTIANIQGDEDNIFLLKESHRSSIETSKLL